ncbi:hypothetical protein LOK49_LG02G03545 [Camellia lanceoleosa]|uniref:Uncharacterized protein n=1 Tax=Camellia lanceoleosa TaxID=1840588 RepID=A0ACC0IM46_9ERIC|nr:hypothetical protein LOK49_LG02G03545 [Camellia lanceoleosa]
MKDSFVEKARLKVLQQLIGGLLPVVLRPQEAQCRLVRCIARELVTCLVMLPIMDFASPWYVNELIECILLAIKDYVSKAGDNQSPNAVGHTSGHAVAADAIQNESTPRKNSSSNNQGNDLMMSRSDNQKEIPLDASENLYSFIW